MAKYIRTKCQNKRINHNDSPLGELTTPNRDRDLPDLPQTEQNSNFPIGSAMDIPLRVGPHFRVDPLSHGQSPAGPVETTPKLSSNPVTKYWTQCTIPMHWIMASLQVQQPSQVTSFTPTGFWAQARKPPTCQIQPSTLFPCTKAHGGSPDQGLHKVEDFHQLQNFHHVARHRGFPPPLIPATFDSHHTHLSSFNATIHTLAVDAFLLIFLQSCAE